MGVWFEFHWARHFVTLARSKDF
ncbi:hypothetical protein MCGE09_00279, partial [Thaumarchaeota archaeon SCGC AB-539-E09]